MRLCGGKTAGADVARSRETLKVCSYNVNYAFVEPDTILGAITSVGADIVLMQETNSRWERYLAQRLAQTLPYQTWYNEDEAAGGMAVASSLPFTTTRYDYLSVPGSWFEVWTLTLPETPLGCAVQFANLHLRPSVGDNGPNLSAVWKTKPIRLAEVKEVATWLDPSIATVLAGDFNESPSSPASRWLVKQQGYTDVVSQYAGKAHTWRWPLPCGLQLTGRYDRILVDQRLVGVAAAVINSGWSDHLPVVASIARTLS